MSRYFSVDRISDKQWMILLFVLAIFVRVVGIDYGYFHGDERINEAAKVLTGDVIPTEHFYPPLLNYINAVFIGGLFVIGRILGFWHSASDYRAQYFENPLVFYVTCRFVIAFISALAVFIFYQFTRRLGATRFGAILSALFAVFIPAAILLSHFSKSDLALATSTIWVFYLVFCKLENVESRRLDFLIGLGVALAFSFKQTYLFIALPLFIGYVYFLMSGSNLRNSVFSLLRSISLFFPLMIIFNIGSILDYERYIEFQKIQQVMSFRDDTFFESLGAFVAWSLDAGAGITALPLLLFVVFPLIVPFLTQNPFHRRYLWLVWFSLFFGTFVVIVITGQRQHSGLLIAYWTGIQLCAALAVGLKGKIPKVATYAQSIVALVTIMYLFYGSSIVWRQAAAKPIVDGLTEYIKENYRTEKILTSAQIRVPQNRLAKEADYARHLRIAEKYKVVMPERAAERSLLNTSENALFYRYMPGVMHGLENASDEDLEGIIQPYAWPLQAEEWNIDYWVNQGFSVFIVSNFESRVGESQPFLVSAYYNAMRTRCDLQQVFYSSKKMFLEENVHVFECPLN